METECDVNIASAERQLVHRSVMTCYLKIMI